MAVSGVGHDRMAVLAVWPAIAAIAGALAAAPAATAPADAAAAQEQVARPDADGAVTRPEVEHDPGEQAVTPGAPAAEVATELADLLDRLGDALLAADEDAMGQLWSDPDGDAAQRWRTRARNLADVPFDDLQLRLDHTVGEVTTDRVRARVGTSTDVVVVGVIEEQVLADQDLDGPARHRHTLTFVRVEDGEGWRLAEDRDGRILGRPEPGFLWDLTEVRSLRSGPVLALHAPDAEDVGEVVRETRDAMELLPERWPGPWSQRTTLVVPTDRDQVAHVLGGGLDLDDFLAFTSATPHTEPGIHELTGTRLVINPGRFPTDPAGRGRVLLHELVHVATRPVASTRLPMWLEEGVAQALGERGPSTGHTRQLDAAGPAGRRLPTDPEFSTAGREATFLAYQRAYSFTAHLVEQAGPDAVIDFYLAAGASVTGAGTRGHRLDVAAEAHLGDSIEGLVADWRAAG
jgi:hypothetical protein